MSRLNTKAMGQKEFTDCIAAALTSPTVIENLKNAMKIDEKIEPYFKNLENKMETMEVCFRENQIKTDARLEAVEARLAKLEEKQAKQEKMNATLEDITQERRNMSLIFTGLKTTDVKKEIVNTSKDIMGVIIEESAITSFFKIPAKNSEQVIYKVQFQNQEERNEIYRKRMKLRDMGSLFINEDLIPSRNEIVYQARQITKGDEKVLQVWTQQGKVFVRPKEGSEVPTQIKDLTELSKFKA